MMSEPIIAPKKPPTPGNDSYLCPIPGCTKIYKSKSSTGLHIRRSPSHSFPANAECKLCNYKSKGEGDIKLHYVSHIDGITIRKKRKLNPDSVPTLTNGAHETPPSLAPPVDPSAITSGEPLITPVSAASPFGSVSSLMVATAPQHQPQEPQQQQQPQADQQKAVVMAVEEPSLLQQPSTGVRWEICIDSVESLVTAQKVGANRVELCASLIEGGITPSYGIIEKAREVATSLELNVMVRPRGGDFLYTEMEFEIMKKDILQIKKMKCDGIVVGILTREGNVDIERMEIVKRLSHPMKITFHRAIDMSKNILHSLDQLIEMGGIDTVLTSGGENTALEGLPTITEMVRRAKDRIVVMPGGGISDKSIGRLLECKAKEYHFTGRTKYDSYMEFQKPAVFLGGAFRPSEFDISWADEGKIKKVISHA